MSTQQSSSKRAFHLAGSELPAPMAELVSGLQLALPQAIIKVDRPRDPDGEWFVDLEDGAFQAPIAWRTSFGFGLFTSTEGFGDRPSEIFKTAEHAVMRLLQIRQDWEKSHSIQPVTLGQLRQLTGMQQADIAEALDLNQPAISRFEKRDDVKISTLTSYLEAMGGRLDIRAHFNELGISVDLHTYAHPRDEHA